MEFKEFERAVQNSLRHIPEIFLKILKEEKIEILSRQNVPLAVKEKFPSKTVLGIFIGVPLKDKTVFSIQTEPTRIELYKESFQKVFGQHLSKTMKEQIGKTVIHEIAHYLGFSEDEIYERGY